MKFLVFLSVLCLVLVQIYSSYAELSESSLNTDNADRLSKRKISAVWGKRLIKSWGKRSESDSDELYQHLLRELHHTARFNQLAHPRYSSYNDFDPLTLERLFAQRPTWNNDNDNTAENLS